MSSHLTESASQSATKLLVAIDALLAATSTTKLPIPSDELEFLSTRVQSARTGFPIEWEKRASQEIDRLGSVLLGPVFTSQSHPWPKDADDHPMAPLCQLNSSQFPKSIDGVEGLVQVWLSQSDGGHSSPLIRLIPFADADAALVTPVIEHDEDFDVLLPEAADWVRCHHEEPKPTKSQYITAGAVKLGHASAQELEEADWDEWLRLAEEYGDAYGDDVVLCFQITAYEEARTYCDITQDQKSAMASLEKLHKKLVKKGDASDVDIVRLLATTSSAYQDWASQLGSQTYPCLLGTFQEIQYRAADKVAPLICFESIDMREWGDGGNAQVFFSKEEGFTFDWSCF
jgi:hypothetical protein